MLLILVCAISGARADAQTDSSLEDVLQGHDLETEKHQLVSEMMQFTPAEASRFWPVYREMQAEWLRLRRERELHIRNFGRDFSRMTDALALAYTRERLRYENEWIRILNAYLPRFIKVLPGRKLARYYQIEEAIHATVSAEAAAHIPLIE